MTHDTTDRAPLGHRNVYDMPMCCECKSLCVSETADGFWRCDSCKAVMKPLAPRTTTDRASVSLMDWSRLRFCECDRCPNCGGPGPTGFSSSIKTWWGGGTLYGVCKKCADNHQAMNETDEQIAKHWREYHMRTRHGY